MAPVPRSPKIRAAGEGRSLNVLGNEFRITLTGGDTGGAMMVGEQTTPMGNGVPAHVHTREDEVFIVLEGRVEFRIGDRSYVLGPDTTVFAPRNVPHALTGVGERAARMLVIAAPAGIENMFEELAQLPAAMPPDMSRVASICKAYGITLVDRP